MRITFVTGCSASGKTALHDLITSDDWAGRVAQSRVPVTVKELDDVDGGVPDAADVHWLQWRAAEELLSAAKAADLDGHRIITGIVWPFALIQDNAWRAAQDAGIEVRFLLLDRPWDDVAASLAERLADWDPVDRAEQIENNRKLARSLRTQTTALLTGLVVDEADLPLAADIALLG
jgi:hypothetical protein